MKKKSIGVLLLVFAMVGCQEMRSSSVEETQLGFEDHGEKYWLDGLTSRLEAYHFGAPNDDIIVYRLSNSIYTVGENALQGITYARVWLENAQFVALSEQYFLFLTEEGLIAISKEIKSSEEAQSLDGWDYGDMGEFHYQCPFDELSKEERECFVYPISYENFAE